MEEEEGEVKGLNFEGFIFIVRLYSVVVNRSLNLVKDVISYSVNPSVNYISEI